jgi:hypothetical protein
MSDIRSPGNPAPPQPSDAPTGSMTNTPGGTPSKVAESAKGQAGSVVDSGKSEAREVASEASDHARRVAGEAREQFRSQASEQTTRLGSSIRQLSEQMDGVLKGKAPEGAAADFVRQAADRTQRLAQSLEDRDPEELLDDVRRFARQRPGVFLVGAVGLGFVAGRFLRAVNTRSLVDAAKSGASPGDGSDPQGLTAGQQPFPSGEEAAAMGLTEAPAMGLPAEVPEMPGSAPSITAPDR